MYRKVIWAQWDKQEKARRQRIAYCQLNNLYDQLVCWWQEQFYRLPGWFNV